MKKIVFMAVLGLVCVPTFALTFDWTNAAADNDFCNLANWLDSAIPPSPTIFLDNNDWFRLDKTGADKAVVSSALGVQARSLRVGTGIGLSGELEIVSGGSLAIGRRALSIGRAGGTGTCTMSGGDLTMGTDGFLVAEGDYSTGTFTLTGGTFTLGTGPFIVANGNYGTGTFTMTGGTIAGTSNGSFTVGVTTGATGTVSMTGGTFSFTDPLSTSSFTVGSGTNATGIVSITDGNFSFATGGFTVGSGTDAKGTVTATGGSFASESGSFIVGSGTGATGTVSLTNGTLNLVAGALTVGTSGGTGNLSLSGGTYGLYVESTRIIDVGTGPGSTGTLSLAGGTFTTGVGDVNVGINSGTGTFAISDGTLNVSKSFRIGRTGATGIVEITGGTINVPNSYATFSDSSAGNTNAVLNMSGGEMNLNRITFAQRAYVDPITGTASYDIATVNMTGGVMRAASNPNSPLVDTSGSVRCGAGKATLNISGTALIETQKLYISEGGLIKLSGNAVIDVNGGAGDGINVLFFKTGDTVLNGKIEYNGGTFKVVDGTTEGVAHQTMMDNAIASANIYTAVSGMIVNTQHDPAGFTTLTLIDRGADIDGSGDVDLADLAILCRDWLLEGYTPEPNGDIDNSGKVDLEDMALLSAEWQS